MQNVDETSSGAGETQTDAHRDALLGAYTELCDSYHAVDDFRMKLLGFLPLTSFVGIFGLSKDSLFASTNALSKPLIVFLGIFAAGFTLALFLYEIRGILRCSNLIKRGRELEKSLHIKGQFFVCVKEDASKIVFDSKLAACVMYSTVLAAWLFTVLRFGFDYSIYGCAFSALGCGLVIGVCAFLAMRKLIAS